MAGSGCRRDAHRPGTGRPGGSERLRQIDPRPDPDRRARAGPGPGAPGGVVTLELGGTYTLSVGDEDDDHVGTYQFQLWDVPDPETFPISIGDVISNGVPGAGAGNIETPGVFDIYTFTASAGQTVLFDIQSGATGGLDWRLEGPGGTVFDRSFSGDRTETLAGGSYTLTIGNEDNDQVGTYQVALMLE